MSNRTFTKDFALLSWTWRLPWLVYWRFNSLRVSPKRHCLSVLSRALRYCWWGEDYRPMKYCVFLLASGIGLWAGGQEPVTGAVSYTHLRAHETDSYLVCRLLL